MKKQNKKVINPLHFVKGKKPTVSAIMWNLWQLIKNQPYKTTIVFIINYAMHNYTVLVRDAICTNHDDKMSGMWSLSTSALVNYECFVKSLNPALICSSCFSVSFQSMRKELRDKLYRNAFLFNTVLIPVEKMPKLNCSIFRFESFGDLISEMQFENYLNLTEKNPHTTFTIWSKNMWIMRKVFKYRNKPKNLIIVYSSPAKNKAVTIDQIKAVFPFVDKTFTVYSKEYATENGIKINCGNKKCIECRCCYNKRSKVNTINELLK